MIDAMSAPVTPNRKRYVFRCAGCRTLSCSSRSDALTCSTACRVKAHRNGFLRDIRALAARYEIKPAAILQCQAVEALRPDLAREMTAGRVKLSYAQRAVWPEFHRLLVEGARVRPTVTSCASPGPAQP